MNVYQVTQPNHSLRSVKNPLKSCIFPDHESDLSKADGLWDLAGSEDIYQEVGVHFAQENLKRRVRQFLRLLEQLADCVGSEIGGPLEGKLRNGTPVHILYRMCNDGCLPYDSNALTPQLLGTVEDVYDFFKPIKYTY